MRDRADMPETTVAEPQRISDRISGATQLELMEMSFDRVERAWLDRNAAAYAAAVLPYPRVPDVVVCDEDDELFRAPPPCTSTPPYRRVRQWTIPPFAIETILATLVAAAVVARVTT